MGSKTRMYSMKQALLMPRLEMEKEMAHIGKAHARENLKRRTEEAEIWRELYDNHVMLKSSITARCTWADILDGVVHVLPPRDFDDEPRDFNPNAEANRKFMEFKTKKSRELLGIHAPKKPSYRDLYKHEKGRKDTNQRSYDELVRRHKQDKDELFKTQNIYTPLLPIISEESQVGLLRPQETVDTDDIMLSARSLQPQPSTQSFNMLAMQPAQTSPQAAIPVQSQQTESQKIAELHKKQSEAFTEKETDKDAKYRNRKRKIGTVVAKHNGLALAKAVPINIEVPNVDVKVLARKNSKRHMDDFTSFTKLPPISSSSESSEPDDKQRNY